MTIVATAIGATMIVLAQAETVQYERTPRAIASYNVRTFSAAEPIDASDGPQLFIDDYLIAASENLTRTTHSPARHPENPILGWEQHTTQPYVTVIRDPESHRFRMWYNHGIGRECAIAYAESVDGIHWETPNLGILGESNRLFVISAPFQNGYGVSVIDEGPGYEPAARRFKVAWWGQSKEWPDGDPGMRVAFSHDGLHWTPFEGNPVLPDFGEEWFLEDPRRPHGAGDIIEVFRDPYRNRYGALVKTPAIPADRLETAPKARTYIRRLVSATVSDDFTNWEQPWRVIVPEERDAGLLEFYSSGGTIARGGLLISFVRMLHDDYAAEPGGESEGIGYATLATSRDGKHWERHDDIFFDRNPEPGTWDRAMTWISSVIPVGEEYYIYYGGYARGHKSDPQKERQLGLATMPIDRFVSRGGVGEAPARLTTVAMRPDGLSGRRLYLNADATGGEIQVRMLDESGIDLSTPDHAVTVTGDGLRIPVGGIVFTYEQPIRLEFELRNAKLFSFEWADRVE